MLLITYIYEQRNFNAVSFLGITGCLLGMFYFTVILGSIESRRRDT